MHAAIASSTLKCAAQMQIPWMKYQITCLSLTALSLSCIAGRTCVVLNVISTEQTEKRATAQAAPVKVGHTPQRQQCQA